MIKGALVGGPSKGDYYKDVRSDYQRNEVRPDLHMLNHKRRIGCSSRRSPSPAAWSVHAPPLPVHTLTLWPSLCICQVAVDYNAGFTSALAGLLVLL